MEKITLSEAIEGVKKLIPIKPFGEQGDGESFYIQKEDEGCTFFYDKRQYTREEVIEQMCRYFENKVIENGQCRIPPISLAWTDVHLEHREKIEN